MEESADLDEPVRCSLCQHPLGSELYRICYHPLTDSPLCALCSAEVGAASLDVEDDLCALCRDVDEAGVLYTCSLCHLGFCGECLRANLSVDALAQALREDRDWECLRCDKTQTTHLTEAAKALARESIFAEDYFEEESSVHGELEVEYQRISMLSSELKETEQLLEDPELERIRAEIALEMGLPADHASVQEEWETYIHRLSRHFEIIQFQECLIAEKLADEGVHLPSLPDYDLRQVLDKASAEREPLLPEPPPPNQRNREDVEVEFAHPTCDLKTPEVMLSLRDSVLSDDMAARLLTAGTGSMVGYPSFFEQIIPRELIVAYSR